MGVAKAKALFSFAVTMKLICISVFVYADCWFSHDRAALIKLVNKTMTNRIFFKIAFCF